MEVALRERGVLEQLAVAVAVAVRRLDLARRVEAHPVLLDALGGLPAVRRAARDDDVVLLAVRDRAEHRPDETRAAVHVDDLVALAVSIEAVHRLGRLADRDLDVAVPHSRRRPSTGSPPGSIGAVFASRWTWASGTHSSRTIGRKPPTRSSAAGRVQVVEDRLVAAEALVAEDLLDEQPAAAVVAAATPGRGAWPGPLRGSRTAWDDLRAYRLPRRSCSRSIASNSALKLPSPKPRAPWRSMISKNTVGPVADRLGEDLQQVALVVAVDEDALARAGRRAARSPRARARGPRRSRPRGS